MAVEMPHPSELRKVYEGAGIKRTKRTNLSADISRDCYGAAKKAEGEKAWKAGRCVTSRVRDSSFVGQSEGAWESGSEGKKERRTRRDEATIAMPDEAKASTTVGPGVGVNDIRSWSRRITMCSYTSMWLLEMKYQ